MKVSDYFKLLCDNRFQIHPLKYPMTLLVGMTSLCNTTAGGLQRIFLNRKISETRIKNPPIFVIGHWRSGTTLMHELLALDDRFAYPSTMDAFTANHFLVSRYFLGPLLWLILPRKRPMDDMALRVDSPQEDDFAMCVYGVPTPYRRVAFPNRKSQDHLQLNLSNAEPSQRLELQAALEYYLKSLTIRYGGKQLVLKSPPHTGRIKQLSQWFPQARFVHLSRHPNKLVPSTMRLWQTLDSIQGFQLPKYDSNWLKNYVFECKDLMYQAYFAHRDSLATNQLVEIRFEDLVEDPIRIMAEVYDQLGLDRFEEQIPKIKEYFQARRKHRTRTGGVDPEFAEDIDHHWEEYIDAFGYAKPKDPDKVPVRKSQTVG